jgi:hypothetical protein
MHLEKFEVASESLIRKARRRMGRTWTNCGMIFNAPCNNDVCLNYRIS